MLKIPGLSAIEKIAHKILLLKKYDYFEFFVAYLSPCRVGNTSIAPISKI